MPLYKLEDFDPSYRDTFHGEDIKSLDVYTEGGLKIGSISDALVDDDGRFRYLVVNTSFDSIQKQVLLPIGLSRIAYQENRVYVDGLSREQVARLPEYRDNIVVDYDYEEQVRGVYRPENDTNYDRSTYNYQQEPSLYNLDDEAHQTIKLYEERLVASKSRVKTGEVALGKHVETETQSVAIPVTKERIVIERVTPTSPETVVSSSNVQFQEGEVARIEVFEETAQVTKEAFVREEVIVKKVVEQDTVETQETIRREELDIDTVGNLPIEGTDSLGTSYKT